MGLVNCAELFAGVQTTALLRQLSATQQTRLASSLLNENQTIMSLDRMQLACNEQKSVNFHCDTLHIQQQLKSNLCLDLIYQV